MCISAEEWSERYFVPMVKKWQQETKYALTYQFPQLTDKQLDKILEITTMYALTTIGESRR